MLAYVPFGYSWWEALPVLRERYWDGVASNRPPQYWMWGNLAALAFSAGPVAFAGVAQTLSRRPVAATRAVWWLVLGAVAMVVAADLSQMSRAEVERIWLPFVPWLMVGCALLPERWRRPGLALQVVLALPSSTCCRPAGDVVSRLVAGAPHTSTTEVRWLRCEAVHGRASKPPRGQSVP